ncbi:MAG: hypothetical protein KDK99_12885, partial [Verrucomicrobiales bacterium]|nr:hypothetical protein [Verrucomicrobiales bacterium]
EDALRQGAGAVRGGWQEVLWVVDGLDEGRRAVLEAELGVPVRPMWVVDGVILAVGVPDPVMPRGQEGNQPGFVPGSLGRVMPGLEVEEGAGGLVIRDGDRQWIFPELGLNEAGLVVGRVGGGGVAGS